MDIRILTDAIAIDTTSRIQNLDMQRQMLQLSYEVNSITEGGNVIESLLPRLRERKNLVVEEVAPWTKIIEQRVREHEACQSQNPIHIAELKKCVNAIKDAYVTAKEFEFEFSEQKRRGALICAPSRLQLRNTDRSTFK